MTNIEAVIFDLGRVLLAIDNRLLTERLFKGLDAADSQQIARRTMRDPAMIAFNSGKISPEEFFERMRRPYRLDMEYEDFQKLWCAIFSPMEGIEDLVRSLGGRYTLGLLSDTDPLHWNFVITAYPWIAACFPKPTLSYKLGVMKPGPAIYLAAARHVQTPPDGCLYIDDLEDNVLGARAVGMTAIRFENVPQLKEALNHLNLL